MLFWTKVIYTPRGKLAFSWNDAGGGEFKIQRLWGREAKGGGVTFIPADWELDELFTKKIYIVIFLHA